MRPRNHDQTIDHIDPRNGVLICGLDVDENIIIQSHFYNARKQNRFVPYRLCGFPAPRQFGDVCEFLIDDEWVVCEFGGELWWAQSTQNGCGCAHNNRGYKTGKLTEKTVDEMRERGKVQGSKNIETGHMRRMQLKGQQKVRKPVLVTRLNDGHVFLFQTRQDACNRFKFHAKLLKECVEGKRKEYKGFTIEHFDGDI